MRLGPALRVGSLVVLATCAAWCGAAQLVIDRASDGRIFTALTHVPSRKVAIVLGARVYPDHTLSPTLADRVACGSALFRAGKVDRILVSGDHRKEHYDEVQAMAAALSRAGIPDEVVFLDHAGFRTLDTMQRARVVFGVDEAIVCTQRFHLPRSLFLARHFGIDAVGLVADQDAYAGALHSTLRETFARAAALFDVLVGRSAHFLGTPHPIAGDGRSTRDRAKDLGAP